MKKVIATQKALKNNEFSIDIYVPSSITNGNTTLSGSKGTTTSYYGYPDNTGLTWQMKDISIKYSNLHPKDWIKYQGSNTKDVARAAIDVTISSLGTVKTIAKFTTAAGIALSLYDLYVAIRGPVLNCTGGDFISTMVYFDRIEKESYVYSMTTSTYTYGKTSHKVWVDRLEIYEFYSSHGTSELLKPSVNRVHYSQYWENHEKTLSRIGREDYIKFTIYGNTINLNGVN